MRSLLLIGAIAAMPATVNAQQRIAPDTWFTTADYPAEARQSKEGLATINYAISAEGRVARCTVYYTTTSKEFADASCALLTAKARYVPAYDKSGQAAVGKDVISIRWSGDVVEITGGTDFGGAFPKSKPSNWITDDDLPANLLRQKSVNLEVPMTFTIGVDGRISACVTPPGLRPSNIGKYSCGLLVKRARFEMPRGRDGEPYGTQGHSRVTWRVYR